MGAIKFLWGLYEQHNNHFFLKFISMKRASIVSCFIFRILQDISSLINTSKPPPNWFLSSLNGSYQRLIKFCFRYYKYVNITTNTIWEQFKFIPDECMLTWVIIILLAFCKRIFFNSLILWETDWSLADLLLGYSKDLILLE